MWDFPTLPAETPAPWHCAWQWAQPRAVLGDHASPGAYRDGDGDRHRQLQDRVAGSQGPIPEMSPGQGEGPHGAALGPWHWYPRSDLKHQVPWPHCCTITPKPR